LRDKEKIHNQCLSKDPKERFRSVEQLKDNFSLLPDKVLSGKQLFWNKLIRTINDKYSNVRKKKVWNALIKRTNDKRSDVRFRAAEALSSEFSHVPNKQKAWNDLIKLTNYKKSDVRFRAAEVLGSAFSYVPDKQKAWNDLHELTYDEDSSVRSRVTEALGSAFSYVPEKQQAWNDLIKLTNDKNHFVRFRAAEALGSVFHDVPEKQQAWNDLIRLTNSEDSAVRASANHSLGKVSIFKASQAEREGDYKKELETAIAFFEKAARESLSWNNPSQFCLPFYRSFHTIVFKKQEAREEVNKYLEEAKSAIEGSQSKKLLFEAVENLANALKEVQDLEKLDLKAKKDELSFYRQYCDRAAELMRDTEETAPFATIAMRKGLPILDRNLKELLEEIQKKAKIACKESKGTPTQEIACSVGREVQKWEISSQEEMSWYVENLIFTLESTIPRTPINQNFFERINQIREEKDIVKQYAIVCTIIPLIPRVSMDEKINNMEQGIDDVKKGVGIVNENTTIIIEKLGEIQEELKKGIESLDKLSIKIGGTEGECLKIFSEKLLEITKKRDSETLKHFLEEVLKNEDTLTKEIESSSAPHKEKEEAKGSISKLKSLLKKAKDPAKEFGKNVANEIVVSYTAKGIVELFLPIMSMAIFGIPIPSQIVDMLANVVTELKNKEVP
jgi:HEAT repeat protein